MPTTNLSAEQVQRLAQLERDLKHAQACAMQPKYTDARRAYWQGRVKAIREEIAELEFTAQVNARTIQARIEVLEEMRQEALGL